MYYIHAVLELETKDCGIPGVPQRKGVVWGCKAWYPHYRTIQKAHFCQKSVLQVIQSSSSHNAHVQR